MSEPIHALAPADLRRWPDLSPTGLSCGEHSSTTVDATCYWHVKRRHLEGKHVSLEARQWAGFDVPESDPDWRTDRGWRSAEDVLAGPRDEEEFERYRGVRWLVDLDGTERELSV